MPALNFMMYIERVPNDSTSRVTAVSTPAIIEAISITVTTPMMTPMTVRNERSLFARRVPSAIQRFSVMSERNNFMNYSFWSAPHSKSRLRAQCFDRIKPRCFPRGKESSQYAKPASYRDRD